MPRGFWKFWALLQETSDLPAVKDIFAQMCARSVTRICSEKDRNELSFGCYSVGFFGRITLHNHARSKTVVALLSARGKYTRISLCNVNAWRLVGLCTRESATGRLSRSQDLLLNTFANPLVSRPRFSSCSVGSYFAGFQGYLFSSMSKESNTHKVKDMGKLLLLPAEVSDLAEILEGQRLAFSDPVEPFFFALFPETERNENFDQQVKRTEAWWTGDPSAKYMKVVDEETGEELSHTHTWHIAFQTSCVLT